MTWNIRCRLLDLIVVGEEEEEWCTGLERSVDVGSGLESTCLPGQN